MLFTVMQVLYVVVAIMMVVFILMQRGAGSQMGSGFGAGASGTVFGSRGSANFLSRSTSVLCGLFFLLSVGMAAHIAHSGRAQKAEDLSLMERRALQASEVPAVTPPAATGETPAPAAATEVPAASVVPAPGADVVPAEAAPAPEAPTAPPAAPQQQ
jgi:preprotein translocase subunit SecG